MPQNYKSQEELYEAQRRERDARAREQARPAQPFVSAPTNTLVAASDRLRQAKMGLPSRELPQMKTKLQSVPPSMLALMLMNGVE